MTAGHHRPWYSTIATLLIIGGTIVASQLLADFGLFWLIRWALSAAAGVILAIIFVFVAGALTPERAHETGS